TRAAPPRRCSSGRSPATCRGHTSTSPARPARAPTKVTWSRAARRSASAPCCAGWRPAHPSRHPRPSRTERRRAARGVRRRVVGRGVGYRTRREEQAVDLGGLADKAKNALNSEKGEQQSDSALDKAEQFADQRTGGTHDAQV